MATALSIVKRFFPQVTDIQDANNDVTVEVTTKDVRDSKRKKHDGCAMAVACKRAMHADGVIVSMSRAYLIKGPQAVRFEVGEAVGREVTSFDRGAGFQPGTYRLTKPTQRSFEGGHGRTNIGKGKPRKPHHVTENVRAILGSEVER